MKGLKAWDKSDSRVVEIRTFRVFPNLSNETNGSNLLHFAKWMRNPEDFANLMITLLYRENYLLDQMLRVLERKFVEDGGYTENLYKKRVEYRKNNK